MMDFSALVADLRDVAEKYKGKSSDSQVSTVVYVDMFTKILQRAERIITKYEDQIMMLWVALNQLATLYKDLAAGSARDQLTRFIFGMCARTVLNIQWPQLDEDNSVKQNFCKTVENVHEILTGLGFNRFQLILDLMENHWTHPTLTQIMSGDDEDEIDDGLEYIQNQDPEILKLRIEIMMKENCEEFALNLCTWSLKHSALKNDLKIKEHQIVIMYKQSMFEKMQEVCESILCHDGIKVMAHLTKNHANQSLCIRLAQIFLVQDWIKPERNCCTQELLKLWIHHQYLDDKDEERFLESIWAVAKVSRSTEQIGVLIDGVRKECGDTFIQLYTELCKYAINIDKGNMEKELLENENLQAVKERQFAIAKTCVRMAYMLREYDFRISKICGLTAFALDTTFDSLNLVNRLYWTVKFTAATSSESKVNPATLYEIERLLEPLRPNVLDPEFTWKKIIPLCKKYKTERDVLLKESCQYVPVLRDPKQSLKYFKKGTSINSPSSSVSQLPTDSGTDAKSKQVKEKELKRPTAVDIDRLLGKQFPRGVGKSMEDYSMKDLDKTINDLKKSINEETEYRKMLQIAGFTGKEKKQKSPGPPKDPGIKKEKVKKEPKQEAHRSNNKSTIPQTHNQSSKLPQNISGRSHQQPYQGADKVVPPAAHRSTPLPFSPPVAHQSSPGFRSPPVAHTSHHSSSPRDLISPQPPRDLISPQPTGSNQYSSQVYRQNSAPGQFSPSYTPGSVNQKNSSSSSSSSYRPPSVSQTASDALKQSLNTKIHSEMLRKTQHLSGSVSQLNTGAQSSSNLQRQHSVPNLTSSVSNENLRRSTIEYATNASSSPAECARIAQQIAQMHLKQRAEREKMEGKKPRKPRQNKVQDAPKATLTSKSVVNKTQISEMLNQTMKTGAETNSERVQNIVHIRNQILSAESANRLTADRQTNPNFQQLGNVANPNLLSNTSKLNAQTVRSDSLSKSTAGPSEPMDPRFQNQKLYLASTSAIDRLRKDETGGINLTDSTGLSVKRMFSMVVPRALTTPDNQEELVRLVTQKVKTATSAKESSVSYHALPGSNNASLGASTTHSHSNVRPTLSSTNQPKQRTMEEIKSTPVPDHVLEFLKTKSKGEQKLQKAEPNRMLVRSVSMTTQDLNRSPNALQSSTSSARPATVTSRKQVQGPGFLPTNTNMAVASNASGVNNDSVSQLTAMTGVVLPQSSLNMLANVATNSVAMHGQQPGKIPPTYGNQNQIPTVSGVPTNMAMTTSQPTKNLLQPNIPHINPAPQPILQQNGKLSTQSSSEARIRLPVTSEQSEQRFMHVFDQFGNKQIVNMTPQTHLMPSGCDKTDLPLASPGSQAQQAIGGAQNNLSQQSLSNSGPQQQIAPSTGSISNFIPLQPTFNTVASDPTGTLLSQIQPEGINVSNTGAPVVPQMGTSSATEGTTTPRQQFNIVPELSPAVVQQILTDLMKTGSQQDHTSQGQKISTISPQSQIPPQQHKREIYIFPKNLADKTVDGTMQIMKDGSSGSLAKTVLDHTKQILSVHRNVNDLRLVSGSSMLNQSLNQNIQANTIPNYTGVSTQSNYQQSSVLSSSVGNMNQLNQTVQNSTSGQFYSHNYRTSSSALSISQIPNRASSAMCPNNVPITVSQTNIPNQLLQVPDLPDLNQFGIDEILRTDNAADQMNQRSEVAGKQPQKQSVVNRSNEVNVNQKLAIIRNETDKTMTQQVSGNKSTGSGQDVTPGSGQDVIKISSDLDMLKHVESLLSGKKNVTLAKESGQVVKQEWKSEQRNLKSDSNASAYAQNKVEQAPEDKQRQQNTLEQKPALSPLANTGPSNTQCEPVERKVSPAKSTFFNAARLAKEREERETKIKQEKPIMKNTEEKLPVKVCSICSQSFNSLEKLKEHVQFNTCPSKQCKLCERMFLSLEELRNHLKVPCKVPKGKQLKDFEYTKIFVCSKCNFTSQNEKIGTKHVENCNVSSSPVKAKVTIWFKCHMCREVLHDKDLAYKHISRFCPQLKAAKAQQDAQQAMDKLKSKADRVMHLKKPDTSYKDPKSFIQDCFVPENSRVKEIKEAMQFTQKETTKLEKTPPSNKAFETKGSSYDRLLPEYVKVEGNRPENEMEKEKILTTPLENSKQNTLNSENSKQSIKELDKTETHMDTNKAAVCSDNDSKELSKTVSSNKLDSKFVTKESEEAGGKIPDSVGKSASKLEETDIDRKKDENVKRVTGSDLAEMEKGMSDTFNKNEQNKYKAENKRKELEKGKLSEKETARSGDKKQRLRTPRKQKTKGISVNPGENQVLSPKQSVSPKRGKTTESDLNESQSTCKLCLYSTSNHRSLARHYTQAHDFGFKLQNKRYRCKYCDVSYQSSSKVKIKGHLMKHCEILLSQIAKCKHLNKNYPHLTPEKNTNNDRNTTLSPRRMKKHMKARAARSKCAENLKRLSYGHRKGGDDENACNSESEARLRSRSLAQVIKGRPRKYPIGQEPYVVNRSLYMQKYQVKAHLNIQVDKEKRNKGEIREQRNIIKTRHVLHKKSRSNSVNSNASDEDTCASRSLQNSNKELSRISTRSHPGKDIVETGSLKKELKGKEKLDARIKKDIVKKKGSRKEIDSRPESRGSGNARSDAEASENDAEPGSPMRKRLRKRKLDETEVDDTATGLVRSSSTSKIRRSDAGIETKHNPEADIADAEIEKEKGKMFENVVARSKRKKPESDNQDNLETKDIHKDNRLRRSLRPRRSQTMEETSDSESDGVEEESVADIRKSLRPRSQNVDVERESIVERSSKIAKGMIQQLDSDADNDLSDDDTDVVPLRKRLRSRSGAQETRTNDSVQREQIKEDQVDKKRSLRDVTSNSEESEEECKDGHPQRSRASRQDRKRKVSSRKSNRSKNAKDRVLQIYSESASSMSEDEGRATPVKERLCERKSLSSSVKESPYTKDVKDHKVSKASKLTEKVASGMDRNLRPRKQLRQNGTFVGDVQASIDVIFDVVEEEYDTLKTNELQANDENDKDSIIEIISESSEEEHISRSQKQSKGKNRPVKSKAKKNNAKLEKLIESTSDRSESSETPEIPKESQSLSVLVDPAEEFGSDVQMQIDKKQPNNKKQKSRNAAIEEKGRSVAKASDLSDDDDFSFVRPSNESTNNGKKDSEDLNKDKLKTVIIEDDEFSFVNTASTGSKVKITQEPETKVETHNKPLDNFGSEFLKFTQKQLDLKAAFGESNVKFELEKKKSDSDVQEPKPERKKSSLDVLECQSEKKKSDSMPENQQEKMTSSKTVIKEKKLPQLSDDSGQVHSKDETLIQQANNGTSNFAAAFQAFAGVSKPVEAALKEATIPEVLVRGKKMKEAKPEQLQSIVKLKIEQSMGKPQKDSIKSPVTSPVIGLKRPGFEGAFQEFFQKKLLLSHNGQEVSNQTYSTGKPKQDAPVEGSLSTNESSKEVTKRKSLEESVIQCNVQIDRLTEREIKKYTSPKQSKILPLTSDATHQKQDSKNAALRPCKEMAKESEEIIILDSEDESPDEISEVVLLDSDDVLSSTEVEDLNDKLYDHSATGQFEKTDGHCVENLSREMSEVSDSETNLETLGQQTDEKCEQQDECIIEEENFQDLEIEISNTKIDIEKEADVDNAGNRIFDEKVSSQEENSLQTVEFEVENVTKSLDIQVDGIGQVDIIEPLQEEEKEVSINNAETTTAGDMQTEDNRGAESIEESVNQNDKELKKEDPLVPEPVLPGNLDNKEIDKNVELVEVSKREVFDSNKLIGKENGSSSLNKTLNEEAFRQKDKSLQTVEPKAENFESNQGVISPAENDHVEDTEHLQDEDKQTEGKPVIEPKGVCKGIESVEEPINKFQKEYEKEDLQGSEPEHREIAENFEMVEVSKSVIIDRNTQIGEEQDLSSLNKILDTDAFGVKEYSSQTSELEEEHLINRLDKPKPEETDLIDHMELSHDKEKDVRINEASLTKSFDEQTEDKRILETNGSCKSGESIEELFNQVDKQSEKEDRPAYEPAFPENFEHKKFDKDVEHKEIDKEVILLEASKQVAVDKNTQIGEEKADIKTVVLKEAIPFKSEISKKQLSESCEAVVVEVELNELDAGITQSLEVKDNSDSIEEGLLSKSESAIISSLRSVSSVESKDTDASTHQGKEDVVNSENETSSSNVSNTEVSTAEDVLDSLITKGTNCLSESKEKDHLENVEESTESSLPISGDAEESRGINTEKLGEEMQFDIYNMQNSESSGVSTEYTALKELTANKTKSDDNVLSDCEQRNTEISKAEGKTQEKSHAELLGVDAGIPLKNLEKQGSEKENAYVQNEIICEKMDVFEGKDIPTPEDNFIAGEHGESSMIYSKEVPVDENICSAAGEKIPVEMKTVEREEDVLKLVSNKVCSVDELQALDIVWPNDHISQDEPTVEIGSNKQVVDDSIHIEEKSVNDNSNGLEGGILCQESLDKEDTSLQQKFQTETNSEISLTHTDMVSILPIYTVLSPENNVDNTPKSENKHVKVINSELKMLENIAEKCPNPISKDADLKNEAVEKVNQSMTKVDKQPEIMQKIEVDYHLATSAIEAPKADSCQIEKNSATEFVDKCVPVGNENSTTDELQIHCDNSVIQEKEEKIGTEDSSTSPFKEKLVPYSDDESEEEVTEVCVSTGNENGSQENITEHQLCKDDETEAHIGVFDNVQDDVEITQTLSCSGEVRSDELQAESRDGVSEDYIEMKSEPSNEPSNEPLDSINHPNMESNDKNMETSNCEMSSELNIQVDINNEAFETLDHENEKFENKYSENSSNIFETQSENVTLQEEQMAFAYLRSIWKEGEIDIVQKETIVESEEDSDDDKEATITSVNEIQIVQTSLVKGEIGKRETNDEVPGCSETHEEKDPDNKREADEILFETTLENTDDALTVPDEPSDTVNSSVEVQLVEPEPAPVSNVNLMDSEETAAYNSSGFDKYATAVEISTFHSFQPIMPSVDIQQVTSGCFDESMNLKAENEPDSHLKQTLDMCQPEGEAKENGLREDQCNIFGFDLTVNGPENKAHSEENMVEACNSDSVDGDNEGTDNRPEEISEIFELTPIEQDVQEKVKVAADSEDGLETSKGNENALKMSEGQVQTLQESEYVTTDYNGTSNDGSPINREISGEVNSVKMSAATEFLQSDEFVAEKLILPCNVHENDNLLDSTTNLIEPTDIIRDRTTFGEEVSGITGHASETINEQVHIEDVQSPTEVNETNTFFTLSDEAVDQGVIKDTSDEEIDHEATACAISSMEPAIISQVNSPKGEAILDYTTDLTESEADIQDGQPLEEGKWNTTGQTAVVADTDQKEDYALENRNDFPSFDSENEPLLKDDKNLDSKAFTIPPDQNACVSVGNISQIGVTSDSATNSMENSTNIRDEKSLVDDLKTTKIAQERINEQSLKESDIQNEVGIQADVLVDEIGMHDTFKDELNQNSVTDSTSLTATSVDKIAQQESLPLEIDQKVKSFETNQDVYIHIDGVISADDNAKDVVNFDSVNISDFETEKRVGEALIDENLETTGTEDITTDDQRTVSDAEDTVEIEMYQKKQSDFNIQNIREDNDATALSIIKDIKIDKSAVTVGNKYKLETDLQPMPEFDVDMEISLTLVSETAEISTLCTPKDSDQKDTNTEMISDKVQGQQEIPVTSDLSTNVVSSLQEVDSQVMDNLTDKKSSDVDQDMTLKVADGETLLTKMPLIPTARFYKSPPREVLEQKTRDTDSKVSLLEGQNQIKIAGKLVKGKTTVKSSREKAAGEQSVGTVQSTSKTIKKEECRVSKPMQNKEVVEKELKTTPAKEINVPSSGAKGKSVPKSSTSVPEKTNIIPKEMEPSQSIITANNTKERPSVKEIVVPVEEADKEDLEEFSKRTESVKKSLRKTKGKGYQCDFNLDDDDHEDGMSTCSSSSSGTSFSSHGLDFDSLKAVPGPSHAIPGPSQIVSTFPPAECSSPQKNTVSTMTAKIADIKTYTAKQCIVSKVMATENLKNYSKRPVKRLVVKQHQDLANVMADVRSLSDKNVLPTDGSDLVRRVSLPNFGKVTKQYTKFSLPLRDEPESPKSVSSESNSGSESGGNDTSIQTPNPLKSFRRMHSEDAPFSWVMDEEETYTNKLNRKCTDEKGDESTAYTVVKEVGQIREKGDQSVVYSIRRRGSDSKTNSPQTVEQKTKTVSGDKKVIEGRRVLRSPSVTREPQGIMTKTLNVQKESPGVNKIGELKTISDVKTKLPDSAKDQLHVTRGAVKSNTVCSAVKSSPTPLSMSNKQVIAHKSTKAKLTLSSKDESAVQSLSIKQVQEESPHVKPTTRKSAHSTKPIQTSKKEPEKGQSFASSKTRSLSMRHLLTQTGVMSHVPETLATDVDGTIIPDTLIAQSGAPSTNLNSANLPESVRIESQKGSPPPPRGVKRKSGNSDMENPSHEGKRPNKSSDIDRSATRSKDHDKQSQSESHVEIHHTVVDNLSKPDAKQLKFSEEVKSGQETNSSVKKTEVNLKVIVLESNKTLSCKCSCQSSNSFCEECKKRQREQKPSGSKLVYSSYKPAIRHIVHDGKVIQIKKGSITETDIGNTGAGYRSQSPKSRDISPQPSERRSRLGSATESPKKKKSRTSSAKSEDSVETLGTSLYVKTEADLNKYIHETLKEIRKDRQHHKPPEHYLRQPKQEAEKDESKWKLTKTKDSYSFKRSRPIT